MRKIFLILIALFTAFSLGMYSANELTVVNHTKGDVIMQVKCFWDSEGPWYTFALPEGGSEDFELTCP